MCRENENNQRGKLTAQLVRQLDAVRPAGQGDIDNDPIRPHVAHHLDAFRRVAGFFADHKLIADIEQAFESLSDERMIKIAEGSQFASITDCTICVLNK